MYMGEVCLVYFLLSPTIALNVVVFICVFFYIKHYHRHHPLARVVEHQLMHLAGVGEVIAPMTYLIAVVERLTLDLEEKRTRCRIVEHRVEHLYH